MKMLINYSRHCPRLCKTRTLIRVLCLLLAPGLCAAQSGDEPAHIEDNSLLVEEAYNQEPGVVQHATLFSWNFDSDDWEISFTQEWPFNPAPRHQLSYSLTSARTGGNGVGWGDTQLNWRYQMARSEGFAFAPRVTLSLPTGDSTFARGAGGAGVAFQLPLSFVHTERWVTHWNVGTHMVPRARGASGARAATYAYNFGQSFVFRPTKRFNLLLETVFESGEEVVAPGQTQRAHAWFVSPAMRWAYNLRNGTQIVPAVGVPIGIGPTRGENGLLLYLSIEHPFGRRK